jgi:hypothetical protein
MGKNKVFKDGKPYFQFFSLSGKVVYLILKLLSDKTRFLPYSLPFGKPV